MSLLSMQTEGVWPLGMSIHRSHEASGNGSSIVQMDVNLFSVALVHMQTLKAKDTVMQVT